MAAILPEYSTTILVDVYLTNTHRFATRDFYDAWGNFYKKTFQDFPEISKALSDLYYGVELTSTVVLRFGNIDDGIDSTWDTLAAGEELRDKWVRIQRHDVVNKGHLVTQDGDKYITQDGEYYIVKESEVTQEFKGKILDYKLGSIVELTLEMRNDWNLDTLLPLDVVTTSGFTSTALDLGKAVNLCFGKCRNVPLRNIQNDLGSNLYDYLIGYGPQHCLWVDHASGIGVHRRDSHGWRLVNPTEYAFYDGTQATPYNGFAFLRFTAEQMDFTGGMCQIAADVCGLRLGRGTVERNFARVIENLLTSPTWGLGDNVNSASFSEAALALDAIGNMYCDGVVASQGQVRDLLKELLFIARASLERNAENEWVIEVDVAGASVMDLGDNDGYYNNANIGDVSITPTDQALKKAIVQYSLNPLDENTPIEEASVDVHTTFGVIKTYSLPFVLEDATALKVLDYLKNRSLYSDRRVPVFVGMEGRDLVRGQVVTLTRADRLLTADDFKIDRITRGTLGYDLECREYNPLIYA